MPISSVSDELDYNTAAGVDAANIGTPAAPLPTFTNDQIADFMVTNWLGGASFDIGASRTISVNITGLTGAGQQLAVWALDAWTMVTGINFTQTSGTAGITFDDEQSGAFAGPDSYTGQGGTINSSTVNIGTAWLTNYGTGMDSYSFQTYMHEIGHALGLDHAGNYNGNATYRIDSTQTGDNHYLNDSWQATVMSYFDQSIAGTGTYRTLLTPMIADILAMQTLYGVVGNLRTGDTTYGVGGTGAGYYDTNLGSGDAFTIIDDGGVDTINFSNVTANQRVDLNAETISDVGGLTGNMWIMRDTIIEKFVSGSGNDSITGNAANNSIWGGGGNDSVSGGAGNDFIKGDQGNDIIKGGSGKDILNGNANNDKIVGGGGDDVLRGGSGRDLLWGGTGNDVLRGGVGRDTLVGGAGNDVFVFKKGWAVDRVSDFEDNIDTIRLDSALWGGGAMSVSVLIANYASVVANPASAGSHVELNFGGGDVLKIFGISNTADLLDDISIF